VSQHAWSHAVYDRDGRYLGEHDGNHGATCSAPGCQVKHGQIVRVCPKCGAKGDDFRSTRGSNDGGPRVCRACGYIAWTGGTFTPATDESDGIQGRRMTPLGPCIKRLFSCVILDEVQDAKSKGSLKGETTRAFKARGKAVLSGTWLKGYVTDLFWSAGWLLDCCLAQERGLQQGGHGDAVDPRLAKDEFVARATVQKARELLGTIELMEAREAKQRELARKQEIARMEQE